MFHRILIVDDSAPIRRLLRRCIESHTPWDVCGEAENGKVALEKVNELHPDIVILDFQMPVMDGLEAARNIANVVPKIEMLMFTMHNSELLREAAKAAGVREVLSKAENVTGHLLASLHAIGAVT